MFIDADNFNQDISSWDTYSVFYMISLFSGASSFNPPLNSWDVSSVTDMSRMFGYAVSFDQNLGGWYIVLDSVSINMSDVPGAVGIISAQNVFWDGQESTYRIVSGGDSDRFTITDGNRLNMISATPDHTSYVVTIAAAGDRVFGDGSNQRTVEVTLVDNPS